MSEESSTGGAEQPIVGPDFLSWDEPEPGRTSARQDPSRPATGPSEQSSGGTAPFPPPQPAPEQAAHRTGQPAQAPTRESQERPLPSPGQQPPAQDASFAPQPVQQQYPYAPQQLPGQQLPALVPQQYPYPPAPYRPGPYVSYQPGAYIVQAPTGALSWFLGLIALIGFPFLNLIITGVVMIIVGSGQRRPGGTPGRFASQAMRWGVAVASTSAVLMVLLYAVGLTTTAGSSGYAGALGFLFFLWGFLTVVHLFVCVVQGIRANTAASRAGSVWS